MNKNRSAKIKLQIKNVFLSFIIYGFFLVQAKNSNPFSNESHIAQNLNSSKFPEKFLFGFSTSSYQIEGAWNEEGKGENIWDRFVHTRNPLILDRSTGDVACDSYHKIKEDIQLLKELGSHVYRFSVSWSRILPRGDISHINYLGINYYKKLIDELVANKIEPMITLSHFDLPQYLQELGGWTNDIMVDYFQDYAKLCFSEFGDKVKWWITINEPLETCMRAYGTQLIAPALNLSGVADYLCAHTILKAHATVFHLYNDNYKNRQKGKLGITLNGGWNEPLTDSPEDIQAAKIAMEFEVGWFLHPLLGPGGDYPKIMRERIDYNSKLENLVRSRLPEFDEFWKSYIQGSLDFLGVNHYTTFLITPSKSTFPVPSFSNDLHADYSQNSSWPNSTAFWLKIEPKGFRKKLNWIKNYTNNFPIFITENGYADSGELEDRKRIYYHKTYLNELLKAIHEDGCSVIGYCAWSLMDNFEWNLGYTAKFGVYHIDFQDPNRTRKPKSSVQFFKDLIASKTLNMSEENKTT